MADTLSLKWIDGNDVVDIPGTTTSVPISGSTAVPSFNIDNPSFWLPLSVISGLASGFCERRAVIDPLFVVGSTGEGAQAIQVKLDWTASPANRDAITSYCVNNMALGMPIESMYISSTNAAGMSIGVPGGPNYMTAMDALLTSIVGSTAAYVTGGGTELSFDTVAQNAAATAGASGSAMPGHIVSNGDNGYFDLLLPADWAVQRKWMLDELRWTIGGTAIENGLEIRAVAQDYDIVSSCINSTFTSAYNTVKTSARAAVAAASEISEVTFDAPGGMVKLVREFDTNSSTVTVADARVSPYAITRLENSEEDSNPVCSFYLDEHYPELCGPDNDTSPVLYTSRQDASTKIMPGVNMSKLNYGACGNYVVCNGATAAFIPDLENIQFIEARLSDCKLNTAENIQPGTVITDITAATCTLTNATLMGGIRSDFNYSSGITVGDIDTLITNCRILSGTVIASSAITSSVNGTNITSNVYEISGGHINASYPELSAVFPLPVNGSAVVGGVTVYPFSIGGLTVKRGGVVKLAPKCVRGDTLNLCTGAKLDIVEDDGSDAGISITVGGTYTVPEGITLIPTAFQRFLYNNRPLVRIPDINAYKYPTWIVGDSIDSTYTTKCIDSISSWESLRGAMMVIGASCDANTLWHNYYVINNRTLSIYAPVIIAPGVTYEVNWSFNQFQNTFNVVGGGATFKQINRYLVGNGAPTEIEVLSGGSMEYKGGPGGLTYGESLRIINCPGGILSIVEDEYQPSSLYLGSRVAGDVVAYGEPYVRNAASDTIVSITSESYDEHGVVSSTSTTYKVRYAWTESGTSNTVWTDHISGGVAESAYITSDATVGTYAIGSMYKDDCRIGMLDALGYGISSVVLHSGCSVNVAQTGLTVSSGGAWLNLGEGQTCVYDAISSCYLSGGSVTLTGYTESVWSDGTPPETSDTAVYYDMTIQGAGIYMDAAAVSSVGTLNYGKYYGYNKPQGADNNTITSPFDPGCIVGGTMTITHDLPFVQAAYGTGKGLGYVAFNKLAIPTASVGWNSRAGIYIDDYSPYYVYAGVTTIEGQATVITPAAVASALDDVTLNVDGIAIEGANFTSEFNSKGGFMYAGFSCYAVDAAAVKDHYSEFWVRQSPTPAEIDQAVSSSTTP